MKVVESEVNMKQSGECNVKVESEHHVVQNKIERHCPVQRKVSNESATKKIFAKMVQHCQNISDPSS